jgi:hypothetical protein
MQTSSPDSAPRGLRSFLFVSHALRNMGLIVSHVVNAQVVELSAIESALPQLPLTLLSFKAAQLQWQIAAQSLAVANAMLLVTKLKHEEQEKLVNAAELHLRLCTTQRNLAALRHRNLVLFESCSSSTCTDRTNINKWTITATMIADPRARAAVSPCTVPF